MKKIGYVELWNGDKIIGVFRRSELIVKIYRPDLYVSSLPPEGE